MLKRFLTVTCLFILLTGSLNTAAQVSEWPASPFSDIYIFGDSLSDTGNLYAISGGNEPPSDFYYEGRYSNGPVWVESLALLLDLEVDFDTYVVDEPPLANNQAIAGAFTGFGSLSEPTSFGVRSQVESFIDSLVAKGERLDCDDLVILWAGANDYLFTNTAPATVVRNLTIATRQLAKAGGKHFLVANLPNLGDTPLGTSSDDAGSLLNALTSVHNTLLARAIDRLRALRRLDIVLLDVNATVVQMFDDPGEDFPVFGFDNVDDSCLIQQPDGTRKPTKACLSEDDGMTIDATGKLFWDQVHPTATAHRHIAIVAHSALEATKNQRRVVCMNSQ